MKFFWVVFWARFMLFAKYEPVDLPGYDPLAGSKQGLSKDGHYFWQISLGQNQITFWELQGKKGMVAAEMPSLPTELHKGADVLPSDGWVLDDWAHRFNESHLGHLYLLKNDTKKDFLDWHTYYDPSLFSEFPKTNIYALYQNQIALCPYEGQGKQLVLLDALSKQVIFQKTFPFMISQMVFSPRGEKIAVKLAVTKEDMKGVTWVYVLDTKKGNVVQELKYDKDLNELLSLKDTLMWAGQDGEFIATQGSAESTRMVVWEAKSGQMVYETWVVPKKPMSAGGDLVAFACEIDKICLLGLSQKQIVHRSRFSSYGWLTPDGAYCLDVIDDVNKQEGASILVRETQNWKIVNIFNLENSIETVRFIQPTGQKPLFYALTQTGLWLLGGG